MEFIAVGHAIFESVEGSGEWFANQDRHEAGVGRRAEQIGSAAKHAVVEQRQGKRVDVRCRAKPGATGRTNRHHDGLRAHGVNGVARNWQGSIEGIVSGNVEVYYAKSRGGVEALNGFSNQPG